jgi:hypothetical protein
MKTPKNKSEAMEYLKCLETDFNMLLSGEWNPDEDSCEASLEVISALIEYVEEMK